MRMPILRKQRLPNDIILLDFLTSIMLYIPNRGSNMSEELRILRPLKTYWPALHEWVDTHRERTILGLSTALVAVGGAIAWNVIDLASTHGMLERMDPEYETKCMSYNPEEELSGPHAVDRTNNILNMMARFSDRGAEHAGVLEANGAIFCYGMDNQEQPHKDHWPLRNVYFFGAEYPDEMGALFLYEGVNEEFWDTHVESPASVRDYTPESSLLFSRFDRANRAVEVVDNYATAIWTDGGSPSYSGSYEWEVFLEEYPELTQTVTTYTAALSDRQPQGEAMTQAALAFMTTPELVNQGDNDHLSTYQYHVQILSQNSTEPIYVSSSDDFSGDWALVDIDRDGEKDDAIRVTDRGQIVPESISAGNIIIDAPETFTSTLSRKTEVGVDIGMDLDGNVTMTPTIDNVSRKVYYEQVPADETATIRLDPQTLIDMAEMTGRPYLDYTTAEVVLTEPSAELPDQLEYAFIHDDRVASQLRLIEAEIEENIPDHDTGERQYGPGLNN